MVNHDQVLALLKERGPLLPIHIKQELGGDTMLIGALLTELSTKGVKVTSVKRGGSPFYYTLEYKEALEELAIHLNEKDKRTFDLLKERKVLNDSTQTPLVRVSLRNIKDYAIPLTVNFQNQKMIFWKYFLISNEEAQQLIKKMLVKQVPNVKVKEEKKPPAVEKKDETKKETPKKDEKKPVAKKQDKKPQKKEEKQQTLSKKTTGDFILDEDDEDMMKFDEPDEFSKKLRKYFDKHDIEILEYNIVRKGSEMDFVLNIPSAVGNVQYYCKAKKKKKPNEGDLAAAYLQAQNKKLACLFIAQGEPAKKLMQRLEKDFKGLMLKVI